jgi:tRNA-binding EMAP/Myf-like protein
MRGVESQAMLLAAEADGKVELVLAPESAKPGDRVTVEGYDGE